MAKIQIKSDKHSIGKGLNGPSWRNLTKSDLQTKARHASLCMSDLCL